MTRISLVAVDLDGTLLTSMRQLAPQSASCLRQARRQGVYVIISTTRNPESAVAFARQMGLADPLICTNGAQLLASPDGPLWMRQTIAQEAAANVASLADKHGWRLLTTIGDMDYLCLDPARPSPLPHGQRTMVDRNLDGVVGPPLRILTSHREAFAGLADYCAIHLAHQVRVSVFAGPDGTPKSLGIFPPGADKGTALGELTTRLGVPKDEVLAIGDDDCDLAMLPYCGVFVAMGNASDAIKRSAHAMEPSNDAEGVAWAVDRYILGADSGTGLLR